MGLRQAARAGRAFTVAAAGWTAACLSSPSAAAAPRPGVSANALSDLSIEQLVNVEVTSVSKRAEAISEAPAAIYVISSDDIRRSGAASIPEILRLAPNLQVAQTSASKYVITARGFSGSAAAQSFSNKLLVLIDGRSVYTPLFSGVYWDMQDVVPADIDRIEVISGPGATLWGANAVNGVINIITRKTTDTQGGLITVGAGDREAGLAFRYGGRINASTTYRLYAKGFLDEDTLTTTGQRADDAWTKPQVGFRVDWTPASGDTVTVQGDAYTGFEAQAGAPDEHIVGHNLLARWSRSWAGGAALQVQTYYDRTERYTEAGGGRFALDTYDLDIQHSFGLNSRNRVVVGGGFRVSRYAIDGSPSLQFAPSRRTLQLANAFVQDSLSVTDKTTLVLGLKLEDDPYSGLAALPSLRATWRPDDALMLWAAASRAIRSPTPFDRDVVEKLGSTVFLIGGPSFQPEKLTAYELGARVQPTARLSFSVSAYYNIYDDLRSIEVAPGGFLPLRWGNGMKGRTYGVEAWGDYRVAPWWKLSAGFAAQSLHLKFDSGSSRLLGPAQAGDDAPQHASLRSSMNLGRAVTLDADLRYVGVLPAPKVPSYVELSGRIGWAVSQRLLLSVSGFNLLHDRHQEFPGPEANAVPRKILAEMQLRF